MHINADCSGSLPSASARRGQTNINNGDEDLVIGSSGRSQARQHGQGRVMQIGNQEIVREEALRLLRIAEGFSPARAVQLAAELGVADLLVDGPRTAEQLATATETHEGALYRLMRALAAVGLFTEVEHGRFGLTSLGELLREDHPQSLKFWVVFQGMFNGVYADSMHSIRTGEATVPEVFGRPLFDYLDEHPQHAAVFQAAMGQHSRVTGAALVDAYDFGAARLLVDLGGGDGSFLGTVLSAHTHMTGIVFDQPYAADAARKQIAASGLGDRCSFLGGDFLRDVPPGADVYMLKGVVHNWPDDQALMLLRNCRRAMEARDSRLLLIEWVVPPGDAFHPSKFIDLSMLMVYGGRERTEEEYVELLARADLRIDRIAGTASTLNVIEVLPA
jgi:hypothetical protein